MTRERAEEILAKPKFGDSLHIEAVQRIADEPETQRLRNWLVGRDIQCGVCGGRADNCTVCRPDGTIEITRRLVDSWELDVLRDVATEICPAEIHREIEDDNA
jgi:hypothetical protein